jgi:hypothetical protein
MFDEDDPTVVESSGSRTCRSAHLRAAGRSFDGATARRGRGFAGTTTSNFSQGDLIGKSREQLRSLHFRRDRDWLQS